MTYSYYLGIDISKEWFDASILCADTPNGSKYNQFENNKKGIKSLFKWLKQTGIKDFSDLFVCMEHTGVYTIPLCQALAAKNVVYTLIPGAEISKSQGIVRGKNDKVDAKRIARYAYKNRDDIRIHNLPSESIRTLKALLAYRQRVVKARHAMGVSFKEMKAFESSGVTAAIQERSEARIAEYTKELKQIDKDLSLFLDEHPALKKHYDLLLSVPGIGSQNALYFIVFTQNFVRFSNPKQFASYSGIAPFKQSSGKSRNSKAKVSHQANKKMKTLLTSAVVCSRSSCIEYRLYFERQIARGKDENSIKNALRNKIVSRVFAIIKRGTPYVNTHAFAS